MFALIYGVYALYTRNIQTKSIETKLIESDAQDIVGVVVLNEGDRLVLDKTDGNQAVVNVDEKTLWQSRGEAVYKTVGREEIKEGDRIWVMATISDTGIYTALAVRKEEIEVVAGQVTAVEEGTIKILDFLNVEHVFKTDENTKIMEKPTGREMVLNDIKVSDNVSVTASLASEGSNLIASKVEVILK